MTYTLSPIYIARQFRRLPGQEKLRAIMDQVPEGLSLSTETSLLPHLCYRRTTRIFRTAADLSEDYVLLSELPGLDLYAQTGLHDEMGRVEASGYRLMIDQPEGKLWCSRRICP